MLRAICFLCYLLVIKNLIDNEIYISMKLISLIVKIKFALNKISLYLNKMNFSEINIYLANEFFNTIFFSQCSFFCLLFFLLMSSPDQNSSCPTLKKSDYIFVSSSRGERSTGAPPVIKKTFVHS